VEGGSLQPRLLHGVPYKGVCYLRRRNAIIGVRHHPEGPGRSSSGFSLGSAPLFTTGSSAAWLCNRVHIRCACPEGGPSAATPPILRRTQPERLSLQSAEIGLSKPHKRTHQDAAEKPLAPLHGGGQGFESSRLHLEKWLFAGQTRETGRGFGACPGLRTATTIATRLPRCSLHRHAQCASGQGAAGEDHGRATRRGPRGSVQQAALLAVYLSLR
jgi:hypothetical protein